jgi:hypothetical protein
MIVCSLNRVNAGRRALSATGKRMDLVTLTTSRRVLCLLLIWLVSAPGVVALAAEVSVRASLSRGTSVIGEPVQYQIRIAGARSVGEPPEIAADGLGIRYAGPVESSVMRFNNGSFTSERTVTLIYQVVPEKNGTFTIPAITVEADGKKYRTAPVALTVQPSSSAPGTENEAPATGFAEFVVSKKTAYIGETIPVELRLYVDARVRWQPVAMPDIAGEGFTKQKLPEPRREQQEKNGREYDVLIFKTAITPSRAGQITLGPSEIPYNARIPRARRGGARSLLDDDVFGDPFFSSVQQMKAKAAVLELTVKPLPATGKPRDFSGAVGSFQFAAEGTPKQVKVGDPVAMKLRVSGRGNFDRMSAPAPQNATGWRTYPPSSTFQADDEIGYAGTKTFEMAVVPETIKTEMPAFQFSYFDPLSEKYVTLNSEPAALVVEEGTPPPPQPKVPSDAAKEPPAAPPAPIKPDDIIGLRYDRDPVRTFAPLYARREFWYAQGALGFALLCFLGFTLRRAPDLMVRQAAELRAEKTAALARLRGADLGRVEFFETAARVAQIETALATGRSPASIDAATVQACLPLQEKSRTAIDDIFAARAELLYAGGGREETWVSAEQREHILTALGELGRNHGRS